MERTVLRTLTSADGTRRVHIFRRERDATFGFEEQRWNSEEQCWIPIGSQLNSVADTLERAIAEASGRVGWLEEASRS